jgi:membrane fusion protein, multidrug efflux system
MKKSLYALPLAAILAALVWLVWLRPGKPLEDDSAPPTEVAVHVGKVSRATLRGYVTAYGTVEPQPPGQKSAASAFVAPSIAGVVTRVLCSEGQRVAMGDLLFQLDSRAADVAAQRAQEAVEYAEKTYNRQKTLIQVDGTSRKLFEEAEQALHAAHSDLAAAHTQQALLRVTAPLAGTVARIHVKPGEAVDLSTTLAEMVDLQRLVVSAGVPSAELGPVKTGQIAEVLTDKSAPPVTGSLTYVSSQVDPKTGTALVRASLPARSDLRPGQLVTLRIVTRESRDCLAVPVDSVVKNSDGVTVIALVRDGEAVQVPVKTGLLDNGLLEVEAQGLQAGAPVVTEGSYGLPPKTKIRVLGE